MNMKHAMNFNLTAPAFTLFLHTLNERAKGVRYSSAREILAARTVDVEGSSAKFLWLEFLRHFFQRKKFS